MIGAELENLIRRMIREELRNARTGGASPESIRLEANLSREQLATDAGVSVATIARIESGVGKHIKPATLQRLSQVLKNDDYIRVALAQRRVS